MQSTYSMNNDRNRCEAVHREIGLRSNWSAKQLICEAIDRKNIVPPDLCLFTHLISVSTHIHTTVWIYVPYLPEKTLERVSRVQNILSPKSQKNLSHRSPNQIGVNTHTYLCWKSSWTYEGWTDYRHARRRIQTSSQTVVGRNQPTDYQRFYPQH